jgi:hypothetical protein
MQSQVVQEFKSLPLRGTVGAAAGSYLLWESPRLTTMFPIAGMPKGSDRGVCHTVNGFLEANFKDKTIFGSQVLLVAGLYGEYAGISGLIQSTTIDPSTPAATAIYGSNGAIGFNAWSSFANLAQNIYIRFVVYQAAGFGGVPVPVDVTFTGALLGSDVRF